MRSTRHRGLSETQTKMWQAQIKTIAQRYGPLGGRLLKSGLFNLYVIVGISEVFGHNHADLQSVTPALAHAIIARHSAQSVMNSSSRKIREKDATGSRNIVWVTHLSRSARHLKDSFAQNVCMALCDRIRISLPVTHRPAPPKGRGPAVRVTAVMKFR